MTSGLISCQLDLDFCIFFSAQRKSELKVCARKKSVDASDGRLAGLFLPVFAPISIDAHYWLPQCFCLSALTLTGKEFNDLFNVHVHNLMSSSQTKAF